MKKMELLSPAGSFEKLETAWTYGADSAYMGMKAFSLRANAKNVDDSEIDSLIDLKKRFPEKKLYCTININFHEKDVDSLKLEMENI